MEDVIDWESAVSFEFAMFMKSSAGFFGPTSKVFYLLASVSYFF